VVEAVSGAASTTIPLETLRAVGYDILEPATTSANSSATATITDNNGQDVKGKQEMDGIFKSLVTRWTVRPVPSLPQSHSAPGGSTPDSGVAGPRKEEWTEVTLSVTFQFANPALGLAVGQLADEKVDEMVEAFEGRARDLFGGW
jgi:coenzyme Q-binding protein COQ10